MGEQYKHFDGNFFTFHFNVENTSPILIPKEVKMINMDNTQSIENNSYWSFLPEDMKEFEQMSRQAAQNQLAEIKKELQKIGGKASAEAKIQKWQEILDMASIKNEEFMSLFANND